jgi:hypothetical protein
MPEPINTELLLKRAKKFFREEIIETHITTSIKKSSKLKSYNVNPFLVNYIAYFLDGEISKRSMAKALLYPRLLGTSIVTTFGDKAQKMISFLFDGMGLGIDGMDVEFIDFTDNRKKYCQLKAGPNNINKDDVKTILGHFTEFRNRARKNHIQNLQFDDLIVGVLYGEPTKLSSHFKKVQLTHPVYVGKEFWYRLTGQEDFYEQLIDAIASVSLVDGRKLLEDAIDSLALEL